MLQRQQTIYSELNFIVSWLWLQNCSIFACLRYSLFFSSFFSFLHIYSHCTQAKINSQTKKVGKKIERNTEKKTDNMLYEAMQLIAFTYHLTHIYDFCCVTYLAAVIYRMENEYVYTKSWCYDVLLFSFRVFLCVQLFISVPRSFVGFEWVFVQL